MVSLSGVLRPLGLASTLALSALGIISRKSRRARLAYHLTLYAGTLGIMSVWGVVVSVAATLIGQVSALTVMARLGSLAPGSDREQDS